MSLPAGLWDMPSFAEIPREMAFGIASLTLVVVILFWRLNCEVGSDAERAYWDHRRHCIVASITELLKIDGRIPARRLFAAIYDEFEDVPVTEAPISVPSSSARLGEMTDRLRNNLGEELREAMDGLDVPEVQELKSLMERVQKVLKSATAAKEPICSQELLKATEWLRGAAPVMRKHTLSLMSFCNRETTFWLALGLVIKVVSQIPGPVRMLYITATVSAASRGQEGMHDFHSAAVASFWLFAAEKLLQFAGRITMFRGEQLFTLRLKREIFAACLRQDMEFFDTHRSGELMQRLNGDTAEICNKVLYFPVRFVQFSAFLVFNFATLLSANPRLVLATMSVLPFSLLGNIFLTKRLKRFSERMQKRAEMSASQTQEVFSNIRTVRSFAREGRELQRYMRDQEFEARIWRQMTFLQGMTQPLMHLISQISFFVGLYYGGILITQGLLSAGEVITLVQGVQACTGVVTDLFDTLPEIAKADLPAARIALLLESQSKIERPPDRLQGEELQDLIEGGTGGVAFTDVRFSYASRRECQVLRGLTFTAQGGEVVGLVGVTGCGKSTVVYLLLRFYAPTSGNIHFNGRLLQDYDVYGLRRKIGVVSQEPLLFGTSIRENLIYGLGLAPQEAEENGHSVGDDFLREVCELANAWEFISQLPEGLATEVGERGVQLSGGQKQRIAIARAVAKRPKVLLLDEATSALDVESEKVVQSALDEVIRATACTTIVIAHRLATLQNATKIVVIESGAVVEQGEPEELESLPHGIYARMLQAQRRSNRVLPAKANGVHRANGRAASLAGAEDSPAAEVEDSPAAGEGDAPSTEAPAEDVPDNGLRRRAAAPKTPP